MDQIISQIQDCRNAMVQLQTIVSSSSFGSLSRAEAQSLRSVWSRIQGAVNDRLIPDLIAQLEQLEYQDLHSNLATKLRSLTPEVTRLMKLLQMDWQFWMAARQADRQLQRQQNFLKHLEQLDQLLDAIGVVQTGES